MILDDWQKEVLEYPGDLLLCTGRQIGKTRILAIKCGEYLKNNPNHQIIVCSLTEDQAKLIIVMTLDYLEKTYPRLIAGGVDKPTQNKITLINGALMLARPVGTTGNAVRGFTAQVLVLDEVSRFAEDIMTAAKPTLASTGGKIWAASTFFGKKGWFWETYNSVQKEQNKRFKVIAASTWDVYHERPISDEWTEERRAGAIKFIEDEKKECSAAVFAQEYLGLPVEDLQNYFPTELIRKCQTTDRSLITSSAVGENFLGVDVGSINDPSVLCSVQRINKERFRMIDLETVHKALLRETTIKIKFSDDKYNYKKIYVDSTGIGLGVFQELFYEPKYQRKVVAVENATRSIDRDDKQKKRILKEDLYENLKWLMESGRIDLFKDDEIFDSLSSVQYEIDKDTRQIKIFGRNTHFAESLIRAVSVQMEKKHLNLWIA